MADSRYHRRVWVRGFGTRDGPGVVQQVTGDLIQVLFDDFPIATWVESKFVFDYTQICVECQKLGYISPEDYICRACRLLRDAVK